VSLVEIYWVVDIVLVDMKVMAVVGRVIVVF